MHKKHCSSESKFDTLHFLFVYGPGFSAGGPCTALEAIWWLPMAAIPCQPSTGPSLFWRDNSMAVVWSCGARTAVLRIAIVIIISGHGIACVFGLFERTCRVMQEWEKARCLLCIPCMYCVVLSLSWHASTVSQVLLWVLRVASVARTNNLEYQYLRILMCYLGIPIFDF